MRWRLLFFLAAALTVAGCFGSPEMATVSGTVTLEGRPVGPGRIFFMPKTAPGEKNMNASAEFGPDGKYFLSTRDFGEKTAVGSYRVIISGLSQGEGLADATSTPPIPSAYFNAIAPLLSAEVKPGENKIDFDLSREASASTK